MSQVTITEALSELNLIKKKIEKKQQTVLGSLTRVEHMPDPFEKVGGSKEYLAGEIQAIEALRKRYVKIRSAIAKVNTVTPITIGPETMTINEWLNWKREQATSALQFASSLATDTKKALDIQSQRPSVFKDDAGNVKVVNVIANVDYPERLKAASDLDDMIEKLDGQLSLKNATITIDI